MGEKCQFSSCKKEELYKAHVWSLVLQGQLHKSIHLGGHKESMLMVHAFPCLAAVGLPVQHPPIEHVQAHSKGVRVAASHPCSVQGSSTGVEGALGNLQWGPVARGNVPTSPLLDFFEWGQGWCARNIPEN